MSPSITSITSSESPEGFPPSQSQSSQMWNGHFSRYSTFGTLIRIGGRNMEKSGALSESSCNSGVSAPPSKSGKIGAILPRSSRPSAVIKAGIKRIADAPGWSTPVKLRPNPSPIPEGRSPSPKDAKIAASEAKRGKTVKTYERKNRKTEPEVKKSRKTEPEVIKSHKAKPEVKKSRKIEPLSTCVFDIDEAEEAVRESSAMQTYRRARENIKKATEDKENQTPVKLHPSPEGRSQSPKDAKIATAEAKRRKTVKAYGRKNRKAEPRVTKSRKTEPKVKKSRKAEPEVKKSHKTEPLSTCEFGIDEAEEAVRESRAMQTDRRANMKRATEDKENQTPCHWDY